MTSDDDARVTAALLRNPLDDFIRARNEMARSLRTEGQGDLAERVAAMRKPSVALWALNQASDVAPNDLDELRKSGTTLRKAQQQVLDGDRSARAAMQRALQDQRRLVDAVSRRIGMKVSGSGHALTADTVRRVGESLRAASIAGDDTWTALREGRLTAEPDASSIELPTATAPDAATQRAEQEAGAAKRRLDGAAAEVRRLEELEAAAREQVVTAQRRLEEASRVLEAARDALARLHHG